MDYRDSIEVISKLAVRTDDLRQAILENRPPVYSPITTVSLTQVGYLRIHEDLDRADSQVEEVSEGLAIAAVRHEIQVTLEVFYDWSK